MNFYYKTIIALVALLFFCLYLPPVQKFLERQTITAIEDQFGSASIPAEQEAKIYRVAQAMGITDRIRIRKMNETALTTFNYHNAFFMPSNLWGILPFVDIPFIYISTGFLEDLSDPEQEFLIGHELIHLRERHTRFLGLFYCGSIFILMLMAFLAIRPFKSLYGRLLERCTKPVELHYILQALQLCCIAALFATAIILPFMGLVSYKRHLERYADLQSVALINSHQGGITFLDRCVKELGHCAELHGVQALIIDHPSNAERKKYIQASKIQEKQQTAAITSEQTKGKQP